MAEFIETVRVDFAGFRPETVDKVRHLLIILDRMAGHPFLKGRVCLHGGTAINLFFLGVPRLSVDIDLNYIGSADRRTMYAERPTLERAMVNIGHELGFRTESGVEDHSGHSFKLLYNGVYGSDFVKIDVDYLNRSPLLRPRWKRASLADGSEVSFPLNSDIELIGGKLKALLGRVVLRDLYDIYRIADVC
jgi:predicted nucleotidyltransferase component of viral defense system